MTSEADFETVAKLPDGLKKDAALRRDDDLRYLNNLMWEVETSELGLRFFKRRAKRSKGFQEMLIIYNNVLSFCSEGAKMDEKHSSWAAFRIMGSVHHVLSALFC